MSFLLPPLFLAQLLLTSTALPQTASKPVQTTLSTGEPKTETPGARRYTFSYETSYPDVPREGNHFEFWVPLPLRNDNQKIWDLVIQAPGGSPTTEPGNKNTLFHFSSGRRGGVSVNIHSSFSAERRPAGVADLTHPPAVPPNPPKNLDRYLKDDAHAKIDAGVKALAGKVTATAKTDLDKARAIFDYTVDSFELTAEGTGGVGGDLKLVLSEKRGNSLDLSTVFVALARAAGIPARVVVGFEIPEGLSQGTITAAHVWAQFYDKAFGWLPVDPADASRDKKNRGKHFGHVDANRLALTVGRDIVFDPPQKGAPLNYFLYPYAEMDGVPLGHSIYRFSFGPPAKPGKPASPSQ